MPDLVELGLVVVAVGVVHLRVLYYGLANGGTITDTIIVALLPNVCLVTLLIAAPAGHPKLCVSRIGTRLVRARTASRSHSVRDARLSEGWPSIFVSDAGYYDYLGVTELLRRRCELVIVSDAGVNTGSTTLKALAKMQEKASSELGVRFFISTTTHRSNSLDCGERIRTLPTSLSLRCESDTRQAKILTTPDRPRAYRFSAYPKRGPTLSWSEPVVTQGHGKPC